MDVETMMDEVMAGGMMAMSPAMSSVTAGGVAASEDEGDLRRGPWTVEEDVLLVDYIDKHGDGHWNSLARCAGLRRTGKSCRLRWLNYLRPDVRRGNITPEEQLLILELHSRWGNRWSKIAQHLPGRTDNEIKNYWRTRVQKHAKQLKCDVNSKHFRDVVRYVWMPRLVERIQADSAAAAVVVTDCGVEVAPLPATRTMSSPAGAYHHQQQLRVPIMPAPGGAYHHGGGDDASSEQIHVITMSPDDASSTLRSSLPTEPAAAHCAHFTPPSSSLAAVAANDVVVGDVAHAYGGGESPPSVGDNVLHGDVLSGSWSELLVATTTRDAGGLPDFDELGDFEDNSLWSLDDIWLQKQC
ncbi:hypothetical protein GUJ93_ZPchr0005g14754 [Zizania palustris]|uniref:Uncharacterized protein n=1 Tax=Zizania palustris TaxID=103762 RepID=A0A8J5W077_ZIZPA|nr:hypothetical protein GUJ93_ZPchr0005g14754 [Zizania palustris]